jgi:RHS repeat-associated protein
MAYLNASTGSAVANYEYNPFGRTIVRSGSKADDFNFKFSSYYADPETDLIYYGYRYYNPELSRWLNKDPIGEEGGFNLYCMVGNDAIYYWDYLGRETGYHEIGRAIQEDREKYAKKQAENKALRIKKLLKELLQLTPNLLQEVENALVKLCPEDKTCNIRGYEVTRKSCKQEARKLSYHIVKAVRNKIKDQIQEFGEWHSGGNMGNLNSQWFGGSGVHCNEWAEAIYYGLPERGPERAFDMNLAQYFRLIFTTIPIFEADSILVTQHNWIEVYGPSNHDDESIKGDFALDPWSSGGRKIVTYSGSDPTTVWLTYQGREIKNKVVTPMWDKVERRVNSFNKTDTWYRLFDVPNF